MNGEWRGRLEVDSDHSENTHKKNFSEPVPGSLLLLDRVHGIPLKPSLDLLNNSSYLCKLCFSMVPDGLLALDGEVVQLARTECMTILSILQSYIAFLF